jgi:hypothetical protein
MTIVTEEKEVNIQKHIQFSSLRVIIDGRGMDVHVSSAKWGRL